MRQTILLFGGTSGERHVSVASAQNILRNLDGNVLAWFQAPDGSVHDVAVREVLAHERPFVADFIPSRPAIFPDIEQTLDTLPVDDPVFLLALHGTGAEDGTLQRLFEARGLPFALVPQELAVLGISFRDFLEEQIELAVAKSQSLKVAKSQS